MKEDNSPCPSKRTTCPETKSSAGIDKITKKDVYDFGLKNNITLNNNNLDIIYNCIKKDWKQIVFGDVTPIFNKLSFEIDENNLNKIKNLYYFFKEKYKNFLQ